MPKAQEQEILFKKWVKNEFMTGEEMDRMIELDLTEDKGQSRNELEIESADEFLLADDADIAAFENETEFMNNSDYGTLAPYGWDYV